MLRRHKDKGFFSSNSMSTHFDIRYLDNRLKWELYRFVLLCKNDVERKDSIKHATNEYTIQEQRSKEELIPPLGLVGQEIIGVSETDKYNNMLKMNTEGSG